MGSIVKIVITVLATVTFGRSELTDQFIADRIDELNTFMKSYLDSIKMEVKLYNQVGDLDKDILEQIQATSVVAKLIEQSWLHSLKPDDRYFTLPPGKTMENIEEDLKNEIVNIDKKFPVSDAILFYSKVNRINYFENKKKELEEDIKTIDSDIHKNYNKGKFEEVRKLKLWKKDKNTRLWNTIKDLRQSRMLREMYLQSYISDFKIDTNGKHFIIKHTSGDEEKSKEFAVPPMDSLTIINEINKG